MARSAGPKIDNKVGVDVRVDSKDTLDMLDRTWRALSGQNLENFLQGPAHDYLEDEIVQRFANQGDYKSGNWPDLSSATQNIRSQQGHDPDWPVNIRTGDMFDVLTHDADYRVMGPHAAEMTLPGSAAKGLVAEKIKTAQQGKSRNPIANFGPTPPRPVLAVDETDLESLLVRLNGWIIEEIIGGF